MNSVMNGKIREQTPFEDAYVQPASADNGTALGAAAFLVALIDHIAEDYPIDRTRVYLAGFSNGGLMVQRAACENPAPFAAFASVAPHVLEGAAVPWAELLGMLGLVFLVGLGVASAATAGILRVPVIPALRRE